MWALSIPRALRQSFPMSDRPLHRRIAARAVGHALSLFARFIAAPRAEWRGIAPEPRQRVYFANHVSNGDMPMIWTVLPPALRRETRPVAAPSPRWFQLAQARRRRGMSAGSPCSTARFS